MCTGSLHDMSYQEIRGRHWKKGGSEKSGSNSIFYTMQRINPLGSTASISSMLYCIYRLILLLWV
ncbi:unnamed protein product [Staurois parvus]|uniref:Uncharacterized protein n=1 Tax=Staurois parvus TaxID=386267 RepID=A0ABN9GEA4_9NEOB|nr:unnamed protein product [Staurois parvus]